MIIDYGSSLSFIIFYHLNFKINEWNIIKYLRDVWAEDSTDPLLTIDLTECENVYPSASAKNYGIEIKVFFGKFKL